MWLRSTAANSFPTSCQVGLNNESRFYGENFKWRDGERRLNRFLTRLNNKFRRRQKPEIAPDYEPGVLRVCEELMGQGLAIKWGSAGAMLVLKKHGALPHDFAELV